MTRCIFVLGLCFALAGAGTYGATRALVYGAAGESRARELGGYRDVVKRVLPAVVSIEVKTKARHSRTKTSGLIPPPFENFPGLPDELKKRFEAIPRNPAPNPEPGHAFGSGFIVDPTGVILTNDHVVRGAEEVQVILQDGRKFPSRDIKKDPKSDLAVVRINSGESLPFLQLGDSSAMEIGDRVLAVGAPLGLTGTVTSGIISAKGRDVRMNMYEDFLQTDAAINPGNSGGPLVNLDGEVIGINAAIRSETGGFQGIGLAISSNLAKTVLDQLRQSGTVHRGYLGVQVQPLDPEVATRLGVPGHAGVVIGRVTPGGPAARCGLQDGDVLTAIAGRAVKEPRDLQQLVANLVIGKPVELTVFRDGVRRTLTLRVEDQPEAFGLAGSLADEGSASLSSLGVTIANLNPERARQFGWPGDAEGAVVVGLEPDSAAAEAGLRPGMMVLKVDKQAVRTAEEVRSALGKASVEKGVLLQVRTPQGGTTYLLLKPATGK